MLWREQDFGDQRDGVRPAERRHAGDAFEENATEREEIGTCVEVVQATRLLRRHIANRAEQNASLARHREPFVVTSDPEIDELELSRVTSDEKEVSRFHVPVDDPVRVHDGDCICGLAADCDDLVQLESSSIESATEIASLEPFHREERVAFFRLAVSDIADDVLVAQIREQPRFSFEATWVGSLRRHHLERDGRPRLVVEGAVDRPHPAPADERFEPESAGDAGPHRIADAHGKGFHPQKGVSTSGKRVILAR